VAACCEDTHRWLGTPACMAAGSSCNTAPTARR
jgi:hypothetical protein